jgi:hypothetical protein
MTQLFANNAYGSLGATLSNSATSLTLASGQGARFPTPTGGDYFTLTLVGLDSNGNENAWEIVKVTGRASDALTIVRAQESTTAATWVAGTHVELRATAGTLDSFTDTAQAAAAAPVQSVFGRTGTVTLGSGDVTGALGFTPENAANKGAANGYAPLGSDSKIASTYLPSYVDDVLEYTDFAALPAIGEAGKIYVLTTPYTSGGITSSQFRWSGSAYAAIIASPGTTDAVTEGSANLYFTNARAIAATAATYLALAGGSLAGNLDFSGTSRRITGDFTNGVPSNRTLFQTNNANSNSYLTVIPSGTAVNSQLQAYNSSDPNNSSIAALVASATQVRIVSGYIGTGTLNPITFIFSSTEAARFDPTTRNFLINNTVDDGVNKLQVTGKMYASGGISPRVVTIADATSITINADATDLAVQTNTQATGTLTINAPTGTPVDGQKFMLRLKSTNVQTFSFNAAFTGSADIFLPITSTGSNKYDYLGFIYNSTTSTWQLIAKNFGF